MADTATELSAQLDKVDGCVSSKVANDGKIEKNGHGDKGADDKIAQNNNHKEEAEEENSEAEPELYFTPKVSLPLVDVNSMEDQEDVIVELRARIYRYDDSEEEPEFKERGTGVVKILHHKETGMYRILQRRDKTLKICANHYITSSMELNKHNNSDKVFLYNTAADLYEGETNPETFAIRFSSPENAIIFKNAFQDAVKEIKQKEKEAKKNEVNELSKVLGEVNLDEQDSAKEKVENGK